VRSWIDLFSKGKQNPFSDSFGFKNLILDFLKKKKTNKTKKQQQQQQQKETHP